MKKQTLKPTEETVQLAIRIILSDTKSWRTSLNYAVDYCKAAKGLTGHELEVQVLYILNNISHWRGAGSKEVRATLKAFTK